LLRLLLHPANFLLLDEPTNHLDMRAKDVLLEALMKYTGTVVFVSHDRYFIDKLATRVFEVGEGKVEVFPGNYEDYLWRKQGGQHVAPTLDDVPGMEMVGEAASVTAKRESAEPAKNGDGSNHQPAVAEVPKKRLNPLKRKQMEDRVHELEEQISRAEDEIARLESALQSFVSAEESQRQSAELEHKKLRHETLLQEWEDLSAALEVTE
jgi:ATP-binding cassette subfamily F protein 3